MSDVKNMSWANARYRTLRRNPESDQCFLQVWLPWISPYCPLIIGRRKVICGSSKSPRAETCTKNSWLRPSSRMLERLLLLKAPCCCLFIITVGPENVRLIVGTVPESCHWIVFHLHYNLTNINSSNANWFVLGPPSLWANRSIPYSSLVASWISDTELLFYSGARFYRYALRFTKTEDYGCWIWTFPGRNLIILCTKGWQTSIILAKDSRLSGLALGPKHGELSITKSFEGSILMDELQDRKESTVQLGWVCCWKRILPVCFPWCAIRLQRSLTLSCMKLQCYESGRWWPMHLCQALEAQSGPKAGLLSLFWIIYMT